MEPRLVLSDDGKILLELPDGRKIQVPRMKHDVVFLLVSSISRQYAGCEYRIHLDYRTGREIRKEMIEGIVEHARHLNERVTDIDIEVKPGQRCPVLINVGLDGVTYFNHAMKSRWIMKYTNSYIIKEPAILYLYENVPILAQPDIIVAENGNISTIIELKTTSRDPRIISRAEELQAALYGYILDELGMNPRNVVLVKTRRGVRDRLLDIVDRVVNLAESGKDMYTRDIVIYRVKIDKAKLREVIMWALDYWLYRRNPVARPGTYCRNCQHMPRCPFARTYPVRR